MTHWDIGTAIIGALTVWSVIVGVIGYRREAAERNTEVRR